MRPPVTLSMCIPCDVIPFLALRRTHGRPRALRTLRQRPTPSGRDLVSRATEHAAEAAVWGRAMHEATESARDGVLVATAMAVAVIRPEHAIGADLHENQLFIENRVFRRILVILEPSRPQKWIRLEILR